MERTTKPARPAVPNAKPRIKRVEQAMQIAVFDNVRALLATGVEGFYAFAVPNGMTTTSIAQAKAFKDQGVMAGVADIVFMFSEGRLPYRQRLGKHEAETEWDARVVFVELKKPKQGRVSSDQDGFLTRAENMGFDCRIWQPGDVFEAKALVYGLLREYGVKI